MHTDEDFQQLALRFPTIQHCPGVTAALLENQNPRMATMALLDCLQAWLKMHISEAERQAALFILNLWSRGGEWPSFDLYEALGVWDDEHRMAFQVWALRPWRP